jgi:hypothetical protein
MEISTSTNDVQHFKKIIPEIQINEPIIHKKSVQNKKKIIVNIKMRNGYEITMFQPE